MTKLISAPSIHSSTASSGQVLAVGLDRRGTPAARCWVVVTMGDWEWGRELFASGIVCLMKSVDPLPNVSEPFRILLFGNVSRG